MSHSEFFRRPYLVCQVVLIHDYQLTFDAALNSKSIDCQILGCCRVKKWTCKPKKPVSLWFYNYAQKNWIIFNCFSSLYLIFNFNFATSVLRFLISFLTTKSCFFSSSFFSEYFFLPFPISGLCLLLTFLTSVWG